MSFLKPKIVVSKCFIEPVRYNGEVVKNNFVEKLLKFIEPIFVCPELSIGMGVPRPHVILFLKEDLIRMYDPKFNIDYTDRIYKFSKEFLSNLNDVDGFLLKSKSPSCGVKDAKLYKDDLKSFLSRTDGIFTKQARDVFQNIPIEDEARLNNYWFRRDFLTKIFSLADLRNLFNTCKNINQLIKFHEHYKYILMSYSSTNLKKLGNLIANWKSYGINKTLKLYKEIFLETLSKNSTKNKHYNVLQHIYGHIKNKISDYERKHINKMLEKFKEEKLQLEAIIEYIKSFIFRFNDTYLATQKYLEPFPEELVKKIKLE
jgi:uncharacterized protein YbgA (DUF1722 family)/uncharacterized protein YbbK (DUF523 family)